MINYRYKLSFPDRSGGSITFDDLIKINKKTQGCPLFFDDYIVGGQFNQRSFCDVENIRNLDDK